MSTRELPTFRGIYLRVPLPHRIRVHRRRNQNDDKADLISVEERLLVSDASPIVSIAFKTSMWARRKVAVAISPAGGLGSYEYGGGSAAAGLADTLGAIPGLVAGGLEQALKTRGQVAKLREADADEALAVLKQRIELKQSELTLAGLAASEEGYAELARLKQQKELLETGSAVAVAQAAPDAATLAALKQQLELATARRDLATEQALAELRQEVARLQLEADARKLRPQVTPP